MNIKQLALTLTLAVTPVIAYSAEWITVGNLNDGSGTYFMDIETLKKQKHHTGNIVGAWFKFVPKDKKGHEKMFIWFNCKAQTMGHEATEYFEYDEKDRVIDYSTHDLLTLKFANVAPETVMDATYNTACASMFALEYFTMVKNKNISPSVVRQLKSEYARQIPIVKQFVEDDFKLLDKY